MGAVVLGTIGAVVGGYFGGPAGAQIGWAIGSSIGASMETNETLVVEPTLTDLRVTGTDYGQAIPYVKGRGVVAGQIWWNTDRKPVVHVTTNTEGGKGGGPAQETTTVSTTYDMDLLIGLTDNQIVGVSRVWANGKLVYSATTGASAGTIQASSDTPLWDRMTVYTGDVSQTPDPAYELAVGAGNAPAYRHRGSVFIQNLHLGSSGQMVTFLFEVVEAGDITTGLTESARFSSVFTAGEPVYTKRGVLWYINSPSINSLHALALPGVQEITSFALAIGDEAVPIAVDAATGLLYAWGYSGSGSNIIWSFSESGIATKYLHGSSAILNNKGVVDSFGQLWIPNVTTSTFSRVNAFDATAHTCVFSGSISTAPMNFGKFLANAQGIAGRLYFRSNSNTGTRGIAFINVLTSAVTKIYDAPGLSQPPGVLDEEEQVIYTADFDGGGTSISRFIKIDLSGNVLASVVAPGGTIGVTGMVLDGAKRLWVFTTVTGGSHVLVYQGMTLLYDAVLAGSRLLVPDYAFTSSALAYNGGSNSFAIYEYFQGGLVNYGSRTVQEVAESLLDRAGMDSSLYDASALSFLTRDVDSLVVSQVTSTRQVLEQLSSTYFFEAVVSDKLYLRPRGGASVAAIAYEELGATESDAADFSDAFNIQKGSELELPAQVGVNYRNISSDFNPDLQMSDRLSSAMPVSISSVQIPAIGMLPSEAKLVANTILLDLMVSRISSKISLLANYSYLEPTDVVTLSDEDGNSYRMRLVRMQDKFPVIEFEVVLDDSTILAGQGITSTDYGNQTEVLGIPLTILSLLDIPILFDRDDSPGMYAAMMGAAVENWRGATLYDSSDDSVYHSRDSVTASATIGICYSPLGDWTGARVFDERNSVQVYVGNGSLTSAARADLLNNLSINACLIGSELVQFRTAALIGTGIYQLSGLLRGGRGTEWAMTGHATGERFVLISSSGIVRVVLANFELGINRFYKAVSAGRTLSSATAVPFTCEAVGLKPFAPASARIARNGSDDATITWNRRSRLAVRMIGSSGINVPLGEDAEQYEVDIFSDGTFAVLLRTISTATAEALYLASEQTTDGLTPGDPVSFRVYQISTAVGRGYPLQGTM